MTVENLDKNQLADLVEQLSERNEVLEQQLRLLLNQKHKPSTEKVSADQLKLFETNAIDDNQTEPEDEDKITVSFQRKKPGKRKLCDESLERHRIDHELSEADRQCTCGETLEKIGEASSEQYEALLPWNLDAVKLKECAREI